MKNDGGPAFPHDGGITTDGDPIRESEGMSLRQYYAGLAMQGWLASYAPESVHPAAFKDGGKALADLVRCSYAVADAMLNPETAVANA